HPDERNPLGRLALCAGHAACHRNSVHLPRYRHLVAKPDARSRNMTTSSIFSDMLQTTTDRGRRLLSLGWQPAAADDEAGDLERACQNLLSRRGEASGMALAGDILERWLRSGEDDRRAFMVMLLEKFGPDAERLDRAIEAY